MVDCPAVRHLLAAIALLFAIWVGVAAIWGPQDGDNALPGSFYVLLWVGLVAISVVVGPIWRVISPVRTVWRLLGRMANPRRPSALSLPLGVLAGGHGPVCVRLAGTGQPDPDSCAAIKLWILLYALAMLRRGGDVRVDMVCPCRSLRGVQRDGVTAGTLPAKPRNRTDRPWSTRLITCRPCQCGPALSR